MSVFRGQRTLTCFFCLTENHNASALNPSSWRCRACRCWNRRDASGEIISEDPAMGDLLRNVPNWQRKGTPPIDRLPSVVAPSPVCLVCTTNHSLLMNIMANYLPPPEHPDYDAYVAALPEYQKTMEERYPPVCENCRPLVEERLRQAATNLMSGVRKKNPKAANQGGGGSHAKAPRVVSLGRAKFVWRVRQLLWIATLVIWIVANVTGVLRPASRLLNRDIAPLLSVVVLVSCLWTTWDPISLTVLMARNTGRLVRVEGKKTWSRIQWLIWITRVAISLMNFCSLPPFWLLDMPDSTWRTVLRVDLLIEIAFNLIAINSIRLDSKRATSLNHRPLPTPTRPATVPDENALSSSSLSPSPVRTPLHRQARSSLFETLPTIDHPSPVRVPKAEPLPQPTFSRRSSPSVKTASGAVRYDPLSDGMEWESTQGSHGIDDSDDDEPVQRRRFGDDGEATQGYGDDRDDEWLRPGAYADPRSTNGLEALFTGWNINSADSHNADSRLQPVSSVSREGAAWVNLGGLEVVEVVALCIAWIFGSEKHGHLAWGSVAAMSTFKLSQNMHLSYTIITALVWLRTLLPPGALSSYLQISPFVEAFIVDTLLAVLILAFGVIGRPTSPAVPGRQAALQNRP